MDVLFFYRSLMDKDMDHGTDIHRAPLSLLAVASSARNVGYDVGVYNLSHFSERGVDKFLSNLPSVNYLIGLSQFTTNRHATYKLAKKLRKLYPNIPIVIGGVHASLFPEEILRGHPEIDYIVIGEADYTIQKLLHALRNNTSIKNIENLVWRSGEHIHVNKGQTAISNLDDLPYAQDYYSNNFVLTSRGCPYPCTFCGANRNVRKKSVGRVVNELNKFIHKYGSNHVKFVDDLFALNEKRVSEMTTGILSILEPITYECNLRANVVTETMIQNILKSGCMLAYIGAESGADEVLSIYKKRTTSAQIINAVQMCRAYCLRIGTSFLFSKFDNENTFKQTKHVVGEAKPTDMTACPVFLYPGIQLYREALAAGEVDAGIWEQSDIAMPPKAFSGYPEKFKAALDFSARLRDYHDSIKGSVQYTIRECENAWKKYGYPVLGLKLAYLYLDDKRLSESYELLDELEKKGYKHLDVYSGKAFSLAGLGEREEGLQKLSEWEDCYPVSKEYWLRKGLLFEQIAYYDEAIEAYRNVYNPIDGGYEELLRIAVVHEKAGNITAALETYRDINDTYRIYSKNVNYFVLGKIKCLENQKLTHCK